MEIQLWREILLPYEQAVEELKVKFESIIYENRMLGKYSPIELVDGRVKKISSILEKAHKKNIPMNKIEEEIEDISGIRIICQFVEDIDKVVDIIKKRNDMTIKFEKDYITNIKESGYRSYHMIVYYDVHTALGEKRVQAEIQIRTLAMNFWATIEHSLQYKYKKNMPENIRERLIKASHAVLQLDQEMSVIRNEIINAQDSFNVKSNVIADILTNIQNLYKVADKDEVEKIQDEFYTIYRAENLDKLVEFNKHLDIIAQTYRVQSLE
ncbi:putative GTP pyrophosphokinase [Natranaerovirga hydrolytica]|uniref:Putative GTP pyrophosphokinase n=1 Tax=Natranaerovirga hydrolytica TaxID=680378 RepID=A0A4R1MYB2_9FIRM|nr:GTP pyrophosphokinase family protein [Natranaerovirga hydrolytica]TCK98278.1 putative GTP pyrophosphokinase [Natranaerovirga hydrolytica]